MRNIISYQFFTARTTDPLSLQGPPTNTSASTTLTVRNSATSATAASTSAHNQYEPPYNAGNMLQPGTFRTN